MKLTIRSVVFAAAAFIVMNVAAPVYATTTPDPANFSISESPGQYTVFNNSSIWYIYGFAVSNPSAANFGASASTTFSNWSGFTASLDLGSGGPLPVFAYTSADANLSDINNPHLSVFNLAHYIAPGTSASLFFFDPGNVASIFGMLLVNSDQILAQVNGGTETPLPAALPLFATGSGLLGFLGWRRKRKAAAAFIA